MDIDSPRRGGRRSESRSNATSAAINANDVATLNELFWNCRDRSLRHGETALGHEAIAGFRAARTPPTSSASW